MKFRLFIIVNSCFLYPLSLFAEEVAGKQAVKPVIDPLSGTNILQLVAGLLLVLVLVIAIAWLVKRVSGVSISGSGIVNVLGGMSMGARERVVLLQVGDEQVLVGVSPGRIQTLHVLNNPVVIPEKKLSEAHFAHKLSDALKGKLK